MDNATASRCKSMMIVCVRALAPFFVGLFLAFAVASLLLRRNASLAGGFAGRRVWCVGLFLLLYRFASLMDMHCPCTISFFAHTHVRTVPLAHLRPHSRKKKIVPRCMSPSLTSEDGDDLRPMAGSKSAHSCCSVYPVFGSMYFRFHTALVGLSSVAPLL